MERESGYYWVKLKYNSEWQIGEYDKDSIYNTLKWRLFYDDCGFRDDEFEEIDETPITRN